MARRKTVTENPAESNTPSIFTRGPRFTSDQELVRRYLTPIFEATPSRVRFMVVFLDRENRCLGHQTLAICQPPRRRIDLKRCLSLAKIPDGAVHCALAHNRTEPEPDWTEQDQERVRLLWSLAHTRGLDLVDYILWGTSYYKSAYKAARNRERGFPNACWGWEWREICATRR